MTAESISISIGLAFKGLSEIAKINSSFSSLKNSIKNSNLELKDFSRDLAKIKSIESKQLGLKLDRASLLGEVANIGNVLRGGAFAVPVKFAMDFESSMADVKKVVDFDSNADLKKFSNEILKLSRTIPLSANELAKITASGGQIGIAKEELMQYTTIVAKMGVAFDMSADMAGEALSNLKNVLQINMNEVEALGDTINHLSDNSAAKASKIIETISRVGGVARVFKLTGDQTAALSGAFISLGKGPEVAATSINTLLNKLMTAPQQGAKFQEALQQIGMDSKFLKVAIEKNPQQALNTFLESLENVKDSDKMGLLTNLFGTEYADDMALLVSSLDEYKKAQNIANDDKKKGSLDREFAARSATTANSLVLLKSALSEIAINIGSVFLPAISATLGGLASFLGGVLDLTNKVPYLTEVLSFSAAGFLLFKPAFLVFKLGKNYILDTVLSMRKLASVLRIKLALFRSLNLVQSASNSLFATGTILKRGYTAVVGGLSRAFNFLKLSVFTTATAFKILKFALIATGIGAIVVGIGLAAAYLIENWDEVKKFFSNFWQGIQEKWKVVSDFFGKLFAPVIEIWDNLFGGWFDWISNKLSWLIEGIGKVASWVGELFSSSDDIGARNISKNIDYNQSLELLNPSYSQKQQVQAVGNMGNAPINITFAGDFSLFANTNGQFDLESFKQQIIKATKEALSKEQFNRANTSIKG